MGNNYEANFALSLGGYRPLGHAFKKAVHCLAVASALWAPAAFAETMKATLAFDFVFERYEDCTENLKEAAGHSAGIYAAGGSGLAPVFDVTAYCRGLFPNTGSTAQQTVAQNPPIAPENPLPEPVVVTEPVVDHTQDKYTAGKAFVDAFDSLQGAHRNGVFGETLQPYINVCISAQDNARNWGVSVDEWKCE